jgi:CDK inhibitor PHO81
VLSWVVVQLKLRLKALLDKKKLLQCHDRTISKLSTTFVTLEEGFQQFGVELNKLQVWAIFLGPALRCSCVAIMLR